MKVKASPISKFYNANDPKIKKILKLKGIEAAVNYSLNKDCLQGSRLTCMVRDYRKKPSRKTLKRMNQYLKRYPCKKSNLANCEYHLFVRIYTGKHRKALKLARKLCLNGHSYSCKQLNFFKIMGDFEMGQNSKKLSRELKQL